MGKAVDIVATLAVLAVTVLLRNTRNTEELENYEQSSIDHRNYRTGWLLSC